MTVVCWLFRKFNLCFAYALYFMVQKNLSQVPCRNDEHGSYKSAFLRYYVSNCSFTIEKKNSLNQ